MHAVKLPQYMTRNFHIKSSRFRDFFFQSSKTGVVKKSPLFILIVYGTKFRQILLIHKHLVPRNVAPPCMMAILRFPVTIHNSGHL